MSSTPPITDAFTPVQADGLACVVCSRYYLGAHGVPHIPVGRSHTGSQVFACEQECAPALGIYSGPGQ